MRGSELMKYLTGEVELNSPLRVRQDQLILGWMLSSISTSILSGVSNCETSAEACKALQSEFASNFRSQVISNRQKLQSIKKGGKSVTEYLGVISDLLEALSLAGERLSDDDIVLCVLGGLGD